LKKGFNIGASHQLSWLIFAIVDSRLPKALLELFKELKIKN